MRLKIIFALLLLVQLSASLDISRLKRSTFEIPTAFPFNDPEEAERTPQLITENVVTADNIEVVEEAVEGPDVRTEEDDGTFFEDTVEDGRNVILVADKAIRDINRAVNAFIQRRITSGMNVISGFSEQGVRENAPSIDSGIETAAPFIASGSAFLAPGVNAASGLAKPFFRITNRLKRPFLLNIRSAAAPFMKVLGDLRSSMENALTPISNSAKIFKASVKPLIDAVEPVTKLNPEDDFSFSLVGKDLDDAVLGFGDLFAQAAEVKNVLIRNSGALKKSLFKTLKLKRKTTFATIAAIPKALLLAPKIVFKTKTLAVNLAKIALARQLFPGNSKPFRISVASRKLNDIFMRRVTTVEESLRSINDVYAKAKVDVEFRTEEFRQEVLFLIDMASDTGDVDGALDTLRRKQTAFQRDILADVLNAQQNFAATSEKLRSEFNAEELVLVEEHVNQVSIDLLSFVQEKMRELEQVVSAEIDERLSDQVVETVEDLSSEGNLITTGEITSEGDRTDLNFGNRPSSGENNFLSIMGNSNLVQVGGATNVLGVAGNEALRILGFISNDDQASTNDIGSATVVEVSDEAVEETMTVTESAGVDSEAEQVVTVDEVNFGAEQVVTEVDSDMEQVITVDEVDSDVEQVVTESAGVDSEAEQGVTVDEVDSNAEQVATDITEVNLVAEQVVAVDEVDTDVEQVVTVDEVDSDREQLSNIRASINSITSDGVPSVRQVREE